MERYKQLVNEKYVEPKEEEIIGTFLHMNDGSNITNITIVVASIVPKKKKKEGTDNENVAKTTTTVDIRNFFKGKSSAGNREKPA